MQPIKLKEYEAEIQAQAAAQVTLLLKYPVCNTKFNFKIDITETVKKKLGADRITVEFTPTAFLKMRSLVKASDVEVAVHGVVERLGPTEFWVKDVMMYPQIIADATVESADGYNDWLMSLDDTTFNHMRFQMHSHVSFGITPSITDLDYYQTLVTGVKDFYIFMIMNKREEYTMFVYDVAANVMFEKTDIDIGIMTEDGNDITTWATHSMKEYASVRVPKQTVIDVPAVGSSIVPPTTNKPASLLNKQAEKRLNKAMAQFGKGLCTQTEVDEAYFECYGFYPRNHYTPGSYR